MKIIALLFLTLLNVGLSSQCESNLIKNGSFELDSIGEGVTGMFWYSNQSPDLDNASDNFPNLSTFAIWSDTVISSNDGGNWQNIGGLLTQGGNTVNECLNQRVKLNKSVPHVLNFEFTAQDIIPSARRDAYASINVFIDNELIYTTEIDSTLFSWENASVTFTPKHDEIDIGFKINLYNPAEPGKAKYVAIDGVCLRPIEMNMFCDP